MYVKDVIATEPIANDNESFIASGNVSCFVLLFDASVGRCPRCAVWIFGTRRRRWTHGRRSVGGRRSDERWLRDRAVLTRLRRRHVYPQPPGTPQRDLLAARRGPARGTRPRRQGTRAAGPGRHRRREGLLRQPRPGQGRFGRRTRPGDRG